MAERIVEDRFERARKCCERLLELVKKGSYCDLTVKMEDGRITIWTILTKEKP
jgi:hypothetical protein